MILTIDITPDLELQIRERAAQQGLDVSEYVRRTLQEHLRQMQGEQSAHLSDEEARLLQEINLGLSEETWRRYRELIDKRRAEMLSGDEQAELIAISDRIEELNARRIEHLAQLARLRHTPLTALIEQLGIKAPPHA